MGGAVSRVEAGRVKILSIIVPLLNEAQALPIFLANLSPLAQQGHEILFVDGGSEDGSVELLEGMGVGVSPTPALPRGERGTANRYAIIRSERGRARQMNAGAASASGDALLFLHADTHLPENAASLVEQALKDGRHVWGRFDVHIAGRPAMLRVVAALMNLRSRLTGIATGDQGLFMTRAAFDAAGGFPDQPLMEDIEMSKRLGRFSRPACLSQKLLTSGRRWETRGAWRTVFLMWRLRWLYWRGVSPDRLAEMYR